MPYSIIRGNNGKHHEVNFDDAPIRVEVHASEQIVEILIKALEDTTPLEKRRFASLYLPRHIFSEAKGEAARRSGKRKVTA